MAVIRKLDIRSESVETIYGYYHKRSLLVNRKYQRKLVWTIAEKEKFIDSITKGLPIPLILVAITKYKNSSVFEIIDGMQRLNAIVSFIHNEFHYNGKFFNLETLATTKQLRDNGKISQKTPALSVDECLEITAYQLPFSITNYEKESEIEEIFRRINSYGKTLTSHELRQAGSIGTFPLIIRKLSENIRKDVSASDKLLLGSMRKISINNKGLKYGINLSDVYWYRHGILTENNIRASRDEELIAHLVIAMLKKYDVNISSTTLDNAYGLNEEEEENFDTETLIRDYGGADFLIAQFESIFLELDKCLKADKPIFRDLLFKKDRKYLNYAYQVLFLAFYELLVIEQLKINNYKALNKALEGIGDNLITPNIDSIRHRKERKRCMRAITGVMRPHFSKRNETDPALSNGVMKLENLLSASSTESSSYDFKQGIYQMDKNNKNIYEKIVRTLCAFVNQGRNAVGYIVVGVSENKDKAEQFEKFYNDKPLKYSDFYINGIDKEALAKNKSIDEYRTKLEQFIQTSDIHPTYYRTQILKNIDLFKYKERSVIILKVESADDPVKFNGKFYHRLGTSTQEVESADERTLWSLFLT